MPSSEPIAASAIVSTAVSSTTSRPDDPSRRSAASRRSRPRAPIRAAAPASVTIGTINRMAAPTARKVHDGSMAAA